MERPGSKRGIVGFGTYVPRRLIGSDVIAGANAWANPALRGVRQESRTYCAHDEDAVTMAVAAAQAALRPWKGDAPDTLVLGSTTLPFADRQNAAILAEALGLGPDIQSLDLTGSRRVGTSMLMQALRATSGTSLLVVSDNPASKPASTHEITYGHGAAALLVGEGAVLATVLGSHGITTDFLDHYRMTNEDYDYWAEPRWVRDEGHGRLIPPVVAKALENARVEAENVGHLVLAGVDPSSLSQLAARCGIAKQRLADDFSSRTGALGAAHGLALLADALRNAGPGDIIMAAEFGQGCNALVLQCTDEVLRWRTQPGVEDHLSRARPEKYYQRFLSATGGVELDWGRRAERDNRTAQSAHHRSRDTLGGFIGGRCGHCGALQYPKSRSCANPDCRVIDELAAESLRDYVGIVKSFTEDWLAYCPDPPFKYGNVRFPDGAVVMMEFVDFDIGELAVGTPVVPQFRIKDRDDIRDFVRYCWKAAPAEPGAGQGAE